MPKLSKGQAAVLSHEEFKRVLKVVSTSRHAKRDTLLLLMSFGTGMRVMELAALKIHDVLTDKGKVIEEVSLRKTKGDKQRNIFLTDPRIKKSILDYIKERQEIANRKNLVFSYHQALFATQRGAGFSNRTLQKRFQAIYRMAGIQGASSHSGRRTFATRIIEAGGDLKTASTLLGHSSVTVTAVYFELNPIRLQRIAAKALY